MDKMRFLVTGATGFAGGQILRYLTQNYPEIQVVGTGRNVQKAKQLEALSLPIIIGDLSDENFVSSKLSGFDCIVHCAAKSSIWGSYDSFHQANICVTENIINVCSDKTHLIYISSANLYFDFSNRLNIREYDDLPNSFTSYYAETKLLSEQLVLKSNLIYNRTVLRPRAIIGVGDTNVFPRVVRAYKYNKLKVVGDGNNIVDFTSVNNLCFAIKLCIDKPEIAHEKIYNVTDGETVNLWDTMTQLLNELSYNKKLTKVPYSLAFLAAKFNEFVGKIKGVEPSITTYGVAVLKYSMSLNIEKIKTDLGYEPQQSTYQTLKDFTKWYKSKGTKDSHL